MVELAPIFRPRDVIVRRLSDGVALAGNDRQLTRAEPVVFDGEAQIARHVSRLPRIPIDSASRYRQAVRTFLMERANVRVLARRGGEPLTEERLRQWAAEHMPCVTGVRLYDTAIVFDFIATEAQFVGANRAAYQIAELMNGRKAVPTRMLIPPLRLILHFSRGIQVASRVTGIPRIELNTHPHVRHDRGSGGSVCTGGFEDLMEGGFATWDGAISAATAMRAWRQVWSTDWLIAPNDSATRLWMQYSEHPEAFSPIEGLDGVVYPDVATLLASTPRNTFDLEEYLAAAEPDECGSCGNDPCSCDNCDNCGYDSDSCECYLCVNCGSTNVGIDVGVNGDGFVPEVAWCWDCSHLFCRVCAIPVSQCECNDRCGDCLAFECDCSPSVACLMCSVPIEGEEDGEPLVCSDLCYDAALTLPLEWPRHLSHFRARYLQCPRCLEDALYCRCDPQPETVQFLWEQHGSVWRAEALALGWRAALTFLQETPQSQIYYGEIACRCGEYANYCMCGPNDQRCHQCTVIQRLRRHVRAHGGWTGVIDASIYDGSVAQTESVATLSGD